MHHPLGAATTSVGRASPLPAQRIAAVIVLVASTAAKAAATVAAVVPTNTTVVAVAEPVDEPHGAAY